MCQYIFSNGEKRLRPRPHGNSKKGKAFYPTQKSTKEDIRKRAKTSNPKEVFHEMIEEKGGVAKLTFPDEHARSYQQVADFKRRKIISTPNNNSLNATNDVVVDLMQMSKTENRDPDTAFVRQVITSPELQVILGTKRQLRELEQFCTNPARFSPLSVDVTFNLGDFYVAVTTYRNLLLKTKNECHPVMIGPIMLHQQRLYDSYYTLASSLVRLRPALKQLLCYGTDEEENLYKAFGDVFPFALHLLCDIHMEDNIMRKLFELGLQRALANEFKREIFGKNKGSVREPGLIDYMTEDEFQRQLEMLRPVWEKRHTNGGKFYEYFVHHKAPLILKCMGAAVRIMAGLGYPPDIYTQNGSECGNFIIKHDKSSTKKLTMVECVELLRTVVARQETLEYLAMCGQGEWNLDKKYEQKKIEEAKFYRMTEEQRKRAFEKFYVMNTTPEDPEANQSMPTAGNTAAASSNISVTPSDTQILHVPFEKLTGIFSKANSLMSDAQRDIAHFSDDVIFVASRSSPSNPHKIVRKGLGTFVCDSACVNWATYKFCSHTLAAAQTFQETRCFVDKVALKAKTDLTSLSLLDMPKGRGCKKSQKATSRRKGGPVRRRHEVLECYTDNQSSSPVTTSNPVNNEQQISKENEAQKRPSPASGAFILTSLYYCDSRVSVCYGCGQKLRESAAVPPAPLDLVIVGKMKREYIQDGKKQLSKESNVYFHPVAACVLKRSPVFISALLTFHPVDIKDKFFIQAHKEYIRDKLGL